MKKTIILITALVVAFVAKAQDLKLKADNIEQIVAAMSIEEKAALLVGMSSNAYNKEYGKVDVTYTPGIAGYTRAIERLGVPSLVMADGPAGIRLEGKQCTWFPNGMLSAASWNTESVEQMGKSFGREMKDRGVDVILAPGINIQRNPLCGRNFEYYSEDPMLSGLIAAALVRGVQSQGVGACVKHFCANNQEVNRLSNDARISKRALREIYLKNFEFAIKHSQPWFVMTSYNYLNGVTTSENRDLVTTLLRNEWGFKGAVVSDWGGGYSARRMIMAGNDNIQPGQDGGYKDIIESAKNGSLPMADIDSCVTRMLRQAVKAIRFNGGTYSDNPPLAENAAKVREVAPEGFVLLKNEGNALPLAKDGGVALLGTTSYDIIFGGTGSGWVNNQFTKVQLSDALVEAGVKLDKDLHEFYEAYMKKEIARTSDVNKNVGFFNRRERAQEAVKMDLINQAAKTQDVAILTFGRQCGEGIDRQYPYNYALNDGELLLLKRVSEAFHKEGKKVVVILNVCAAVEVASWQDMADAVMVCWLPGEEAGHSVADVLTGVVSPSGKLPVTFSVKYEDEPTAQNFPRVNEDKTLNYSFFRYSGVQPRYDVPNIDYTNYEEGIYVGYRYFNTKDVKVAYPFGYGLSYTTFDFSDLKVSDKGDKLELTVKVSNTGSRSGKEVVEIYSQAPEGGLDKPACELKAFGKTRQLNPGESEVVKLSIDKEQLASYDEQESAWVAPQGDYTLMVSRDVNTPVLIANYNLKKKLVVKTNDILGVEPLFIK